MSRLYRRISSSTSHHNAPRTELDSHADTCAFGKHCFVSLSYSDSFTVNSFHPELPTIKNVREVEAVIAYDCPILHQTFVLHFDRVLHIPDLPHNLSCVDQLRDHGTVVNDVPLIRLYFLFLYAPLLTD